jgi:hypothetical protein
MSLKIQSKVPETYQKIKADLEGDKAHCAVIAIAAITKLPPKKVQAALAKAGRKPRCGTSPAVQEKALEALGFKVTKLGMLYLRKLIKSYPGRASSLENVTTHHPRRLPSAWVGQPDMLLFNHTHVCAYVDGQIVDWSIQHSKYIVDAWKVERIKP